MNVIEVLHGLSDSVYFYSEKTKQNKSSEHPYNYTGITKSSMIVNSDTKKTEFLGFKKVL